MSDAPTHYEVLGIGPGASKAETKAAYQRALAAADQAGDADALAAARRAWQVLADPQQRTRYDEALRLAGTTVAAPEVPTASGSDLVVADVEEAEIVDDGAADDFPGDPEINQELRPGERRAGTLPLGAPAFLEQPTTARRMVAALIDVITFVAVGSISLLITIQAAGLEAGGGQIAAFAVWTEVWILALFVVPTVRTGQTLGKRMTYIMTVDRVSGGLLTPSQGLRRYVIPMLAIPVLVQMGAFLSLFYGLSFSMGRDQISLADRVARSIVVVARYRPTRQSAAR